MSPTQQERRIQALYDDANVSRRYLCERVVHLEADMEELRCKLSSTFDGRERMFRANVEKNRDLMHLMDEGAKLRMLVHALLQCHVEDTDTCAKCRYRSPLHGWCMADVKADELGVES